MMRSMYSAVSGLKSHQTKMDVIGNNVSNVNTVSFKSSSVTFNDIMYQTIATASGANPETGTGGVNAKQIGLGVAVGSTQVSITSAGAAQSTGNPFDVRITDANSTNFFIVNNGSENLFTRAGSFYVDGSGNLCMTSTGYTVMGWQTDPATGEIKKDTVSPLTVMQTKNLTSAPEATTKAYVAGILDKESTDLNSDSGLTVTLNLYDQLGYQYTAKFKMTPNKAQQEVPNPDFDPDQPESDTNKKNITKEVVQEGKFDIELTSVYGPEDAEGNSTNLLEGKDSDYISNNIFKKSTITFNTTDGTFESIGDSTDGVMQLNLAQLNDNGNGNPAGPLKAIDVDFKGIKNANNGKNSTVSITPGTSSMDTTGKGKKLGALTGLSIDTSGQIWGSYDNGNTVLLCQMAVAQFANASGLEKVGENCYTTTLNSGDFDGIGVAITADGSKMSSGQLEMSNVDLSQEFTDMITTQRGFQANSRIITTSDTLLEELVNLKR